MSTSVRSRLSPETLAWARLASGFEAEEIAKSAGVSPERYAEWEAGGDRPTFRQLLKVANKVKRPIALFYMRKPPAEPPMPHDFRVVAGSRQSQYSPELRLEIRKAERLQLLIAVLSEDLELPDSRGFPSITQQEDADDAARAIRSYLGLSIEEQVSIGDPAVLYREWRDAIFKRGVIPIQFGVDRDEALGFALWHDYAPLVAVNTRQAAEAKTFTLLHELAHIALRMPGVSDASIPFREVYSGNSHAAIEAYCNRIASAVLLPDSKVVRQVIDSLGGGTITDLDSFRRHARRFGVSKYALAYRIAALRPELSDRIQASVSSWLAIDSSQRPVAKKSAGGPPPALTTLGRRGRSFSRAVLTAVKESRISADDARDLLDLEPHHFSQLEQYAFRTGSNEEDSD